MAILKELFSVLNEKKVADDEYFVTVGTGKKFDLFTEKAFKSVEAAQKFIDREIKNADDTEAAEAECEQLENAEIMSGSQLKKKYPKLFEAAKAAEDEDCVSRQCHAQAAAKSKKDGVVQHINKDKRTGKLYVSDWFDDDETVATYNKGKLSESADLAKQLVRGEKSPKGLMAKLDHWLGKMMVTKDANRFLPSESAVKALKSYGFSGDQVHKIREAAAEAAQTAIARMQKKHGDAVPDKYLSKMGSSFAVFDLYLNVSEAIHKEFAALMRQLFDAKIDKMKDELMIIKEARSVPGWFADGAQVKLMPEYADKDPNEVFTLKSVDTETGKGRIADDQGKGWNISYYQVYPKNKTPAIHEGFDGGKRAFKRAELEFELGHEDRAAGNRTFSYSKPRAELGSFGIEINGRLFKREGEPVKFTSKVTAEKAATTIASKDFNKGKTVKVVPLQEDAALQGLGKSLAGKTTDEKPADGVDVPMGDEAEKSTGPSDTQVTGDADDQQTSAEFKVGDVVKTLVGPHKGEEHDVIKVHSDGRMDLKPKGIEGTAVKYRNGGVTAKPDQVVLAESIIRGTKTLLRTITIDLSEARGDGMMPLSYKPAKGHKIEAYGRKGMKNTMWRKYFKDADAMAKWCEDNDATVEGSRDLDKDELR